MKKQTPEYGYYSKLLNKPFDTVEELITAEEELRKAEEAKKVAADLRKSDAGRVKDAYIAYKNSKKDYNKQLIDLRKEYNDAVQLAKTRYNEKAETFANAMAIAAEEYNKLLTEFNQKYPGGYHLTLKETDDGVEVEVKETKAEEETIVDSAAEFLNRLIANFYNFFRN